MDQLEKNKTLRYILTTLLAIGNFLNSTNVSNPQDINGLEVPLFSLSLSLCLLLTSTISAHTPPPPPPTPPPTYLFGKDNSGLSMWRRMCCLTVCTRHCPSTVKTLVKASAEPGSVCLSDCLRRKREGGCAIVCFLTVCVRLAALCVNLHLCLGLVFSGLTLCLSVALRRFHVHASVCTSTY